MSSFMDYVLSLRATDHLADKTRSLVQYDREQALADPRSYCRNTVAAVDHRPRVRYCFVRRRIESVEPHVVGGQRFHLSLPLDEVKAAGWIHRAASLRGELHRNNAEALKAADMDSSEVYERTRLLSDLYFAWSYELALAELRRQGVLRED